MQFGTLRCWEFSSVCVYVGVCVCACVFKVSIRLGMNIWLQGADVTCFTWAFSQWCLNLVAFVLVCMHIHINIYLKNFVNCT